MQGDSPMSPEADQDPPAENPGRDWPPPAGAPAGAADGEQLEEQWRAGGGSPGTPQLQLLPGPQLAGPRHAPKYSAVDTVTEEEEDGPGPRCGHTLTAVASVGEEGSLGYVGPRLIMFGGATSLEGNPAASGPPSSPGGGGAGISTRSSFH